jgi:hypothetical protein
VRLFTTGEQSVGTFLAGEKVATCHNLVDSVYALVFTKEVVLTWVTENQRNMLDVSGAVHKV